MKIAFACDHAGFSFREEVLKYLSDLWHEVIDLGPQTMEPLDDFPDYASHVCQKIQAQEAERGVLICGTWIGMSIAANKFHGIRAVLTYNPEIAKISRSHNDANVACFGARTMDMETVRASLFEFLNTNFLWDKYQTRNEKIDNAFLT